MSYRQPRVGVKYQSRPTPSQNYRANRRAALMSKKRERDAITLLNTRTGGFLGRENKFFDRFIVAATVVANSGLTGGEVDPDGLTLSAPAQNDGESGRDGRKIMVNSVYVDGVVELPLLNDQAFGSDPVSVMICLVQDKQSNGAQLNSEDVYVNPSGSITLCPNPLRNLQYTSRFRVLAKETLVLTRKTMTNPDGTNVTQSAIKERFVLSKKLQMPVLFNNTANQANVSQVIDNSLHIIAFCDNIVTPAILSYHSRIRFTG